MLGSRLLHPARCVRPGAGAITAQRSPRGRSCLTLASERDCAVSARPQLGVASCAGLTESRTASVAQTHLPVRHSTNGTTETSHSWASTAQPAAVCEAPRSGRSGQRDRLTLVVLCGPSGTGTAARRRAAGVSIDEEQR
eukprot:Selendium_serpulae@DN9662_c0_g1_i1.p1